jgi:GTP-binding protein
MEITGAEFVTSAISIADFPKEKLPQIALVGRSNVGKSSLINTLTGFSRLARTSNTPGRTRTINFYKINEAFYLVDLPGYGFANVPKSIRKQWDKMINDYFFKAEKPHLVLQMIDIRHDPMPLDLEIDEWLGSVECRRVIVATKADKIAKRDISKQRTKIKETLSASDVIAFSAKTGLGRGEILKAINENIGVKYI